MLPPSLRSRKRPAGHLAPRRPIPRLHRCRVPAACARHALLNILGCVSAYKRRASECLLTMTHAQARRLALSIPLFRKLTKGDVRGAVGQVRNAGCNGARRRPPHNSYYQSAVSERVTVSPRQDPENVSKCVIIQTCSTICAKVLDASTFRSKLRPILDQFARCRSKIAVKCNNNSAFSS